MAGQPKPFRPAEEHQSAVLHSSAKGKFEEIGFLYSRLFSHLCNILSTVHLFIVTPLPSYFRIHRSPMLPACSLLKHTDALKIQPTDQASRA